MLNDPLANVMSLIVNNEAIGKSECMIKPVSKVIKEILQVMKDNGYIGDFKETVDSRGNYINITLYGSINKCGVIKPRYSVKKEEFEKFEEDTCRQGPWNNICFNSKRNHNHYDAKAKKIGGKLLAYCY